MKSHLQRRLECYWKANELTTLFNSKEDSVTLNEPKANIAHNH